jgi:hypothetical protein
MNWLSRYQRRGRKDVGGTSIPLRLIILDDNRRNRDGSTSRDALASNAVAHLGGFGSTRTPRRPAS